MTVGTAPYVQPTAPCTRCSQYIRFASICLSVYLPTVPVPVAFHNQPALMPDIDAKRQFCAL